MVPRRRPCRIAWSGWAIRLRRSAAPPLLEAFFDGIVVLQKDEREHQGRANQQVGNKSHVALKQFEVNGQILLRILADRLHKVARLYQHLVGIVIKAWVLEELASATFALVELGGQAG